MNGHFFQTSHLCEKMAKAIRNDINLKIISYKFNKCELSSWPCLIKVAILNYLLYILSILIILIDCK